MTGGREGGVGVTEVVLGAGRGSRSHEPPGSWPASGHKGQKLRPTQTSCLMCRCGCGAREGGAHGRESKWVWLSTHFARAETGAGGGSELLRIDTYTIDGCFCVGKGWDVGLFMLIVPYLGVFAITVVYTAA